MVESRFHECRPRLCDDEAQLLMSFHYGAKRESRRIVNAPVRESPTVPAAAQDGRPLGDLSRSDGRTQIEAVCEYPP